MKRNRLYAFAMAGALAVSNLATVVSPMTAIVAQAAAPAGTATDALYQNSTKIDATKLVDNSTPGASTTVSILDTKAAGVPFFVDISNTGLNLAAANLAVGVVDKNGGNVALTDVGDTVSNAKGVGEWTAASTNVGVSAYLDTDGTRLVVKPTKGKVGRAIVVVGEKSGTNIDASVGKAFSYVIVDVYDSGSYSVIDPEYSVNAVKNATDAGLKAYATDGKATMFINTGKEGSDEIEFGRKASDATATTDYAALPLASVVASTNAKEKEYNVTADTTNFLYPKGKLKVTLGSSDIVQQKGTLNTNAIQFQPIAVGNTTATFTYTPDDSNLPTIVKTIDIEVTEVLENGNFTVTGSDSELKSDTESDKFSYAIGKYTTTGTSDKAAANSKIEWTDAAGVVKLSDDGNGKVTVTPLKEGSSNISGEFTNDIDKLFVALEGANTVTTGIPTFTVSGINFKTTITYLGEEADKIDILEGGKVAAGATGIDYIHTKASSASLTATWEIDDEKVAKINKTTGAIEAVGTGKATITLTLEYLKSTDANYEKATDTIELNVIDPAAEEAAKKAAEEAAKKQAEAEVAAKKAQEEAAAAKKAAEEAAAKKAAEEAAAAEAKKGVPAGTTKTVSGTTYKGIDGTSVQITKTANKKSVKIGKTVTVDGKVLKVTKIGSKAVTGKKVKNVTIDASNIKKASNININMFKGAKNLTSVKIKGVKKNSAVYKRIVKAAKKVNKNVKIK